MTVCLAPVAECVENTSRMVSSLHRGLEEMNENANTNSVSLRMGTLLLF